MQALPCSPWCETQAQAASSKAMVEAPQTGGSRTDCPLRSTRVEAFCLMLTSFLVSVLFLVSVFVLNVFVLGSWFVPGLWVDVLGSPKLGHTTVFNHLRLSTVSRSCSAFLRRCCVVVRLVVAEHFTNSTFVVTLHSSVLACIIVRRHRWPEHPSWCSARVVRHVSA